jgi:hypothetical protein
MIKDNFDILQKVTIKKKDYNLTSKLQKVLKPDFDLDVELKNLFEKLRKNLNDRSLSKKLTNKIILNRNEFQILNKFIDTFTNQYYQIARNQNQKIGYLCKRIPREDNNRIIKFKKCGFSSRDFLFKFYDKKIDLKKIFLY